jgi:nucleoside-diphosphate-sugar epimerase
MVQRVLTDFQPDLIFHLAALVPIPLVEKDHEKAFRVNVLGFDNLLSAVETLNKPVQIILTSSSEVYGNGNKGIPFVERDPFFPNNFYAYSKVAQEHLAFLYQKRGLKIKIARIFNYSSIYKAPIYSLESFADQIAKCILEKKERKIKVGNLMPERDFLQGKDVAKALLAIAFQHDTEFLFNVSRGSVVSMQTLLEIMIEKYSVDIEIIKDTEKYRKIDNLFVCGNNTLLKNLGWKPEISIHQMIKILVDHNKSKYNI